MENMNNNELLQEIKQVIKTEVKEAIAVELKDVREDIKDMKDHLEVIDGRLDNLEGRLENVESEVVRTNIIIESRIEPGIKAVKEGILGLEEKNKEWREEYDEWVATVSALDMLHIDGTPLKHKVK